MAELTKDHAHCPACGECLPNSAEFVAEIGKPTADHPHFTLEAPPEVMQIVVACALAGMALATPGTSAEEMRLHMAFLPLVRIMDEQNFTNADTVLRLLADSITKHEQHSFKKNMDSILDKLFNTRKKD